MDGDNQRDIARGSSLDPSKKSTHPVSSNSGAGELSGETDCLISPPDSESTLSSLMSSMTVESYSGDGDAIASDAAEESTPPAEIENESPAGSSVDSIRPQSSSKAGSFFISDASTSHNTEEWHFPIISTPEVSLKGGAGSSISEVTVSSVLSPGNEEKAHSELHDMFTPDELRVTGTPGRGDIVGDLSSEGGLLYSNDPAFKNKSVSLGLDSPILATGASEKTIPSFDEVTPEEIRMTSTPLCGRIVGDLSSGRGYLYSDDPETKTTSVPSDPCSPIPFANPNDAP